VTDGLLTIGKVALVCMTPMLDVMLPGDPVAKERHRTGGRDPRTGKPRHYPGRKSDPWEKWAAWEIRAAWLYGERVLREPCVVHVCAVLSRPKVLEHKAEADGRILRDQKPDGDNVLKACLDAIEKSGVLDDDKRVAVKAVESWWCARGEEPHVRVVLGLPPIGVACRVRRVG